MIEDKYRITDEQIRAIATAMRKLLPPQFHAQDEILFLAAVTDVVRNRLGSTDVALEAAFTTVMSYVIAQGIPAHRLHEIIDNELPTVHAVQGMQRKLVGAA